MGLQFNYEITKEGIAKMEAVRNIPKAYKKQLTTWLTYMVYDAKRSAKAMQKSDRKTGQLDRNIGMQVKASGDLYVGSVGTGVGKTQTVKYASLQDQGGTNTAKKKYLTIPFPGVTLKARQYDKTFFTTSKAGNLIIGQSLGKGKWRPLFLLKKSVIIPASSWFTYPVIIHGQSQLDEMMSSEAILAVAGTMGKK